MCLSLVCTTVPRVCVCAHVYACVYVLQKYANRFCTADDFFTAAEMCLKSARIVQNISMLSNFFLLYPVDMRLWEGYNKIVSLEIHCKSWVSYSSIYVPSIELITILNIYCIYAFKLIYSWTIWLDFCKLLILVLVLSYFYWFLLFICSILMYIVLHIHGFIYIPELYVSNCYNFIGFS